MKRTVFLLVALGLATLTVWPGRAFATGVAHWRTGSGFRQTVPATRIVIQNAEPRRIYFGVSDDQRNWKTMSLKAKSSDFIQSRKWLRLNNWGSVTDYKLEQGYRYILERDKDSRKIVLSKVKG